MRAIASVLLTLVGGLVIPACGTVPPVVPDPGNDQVTSSWTAEKQESAMRAAVAGAEAIAQSVAAILPVSDLQDIFEGGAFPPVCPNLDTEFDGNDIVLTLGYGVGCTPRYYKNSRLSGAVRGTAFIAFNAFDLELDGAGFDGIALEGSIGGSFSFEAGTTRFTASPNLVLHDGSTASGTVTIEVDDATGAIVTSEATVRLSTPDGDAFNATFTDLHADPGTNGSFIPTSGAVTLTETNTADGTEQEAISFEFTADTPISGTAMQIE